MLRRHFYKKIYHRQTNHRLFLSGDSPANALTHMSAVLLKEWMDDAQVRGALREDH